MDTKEKLSEVVYQSILSDILSGKYSVDQVLNEQEFCSIYQCSKSPVRAALLLLCQEGILRCIPRYGYEIARISLKHIEDLLNMRYLLEGGIVTANMTSFTENQINILESVLYKSNDSTLNISDSWDVNASFHLQLMSFCKNNYAYDILVSIMKKLKMSYIQFYQDNLSRGISEYSTHSSSNHQAMVQCFRDRDTDAFLYLLRKGLSHFGNKDFELLDYFNCAGKIPPSLSSIQAELNHQAAASSAEHTAEHTEHIG